MSRPSAARTPSLLPLLLALPAGTIAGLHRPRAPADADVDSSLARFGPRLRTEAELRHAAIRVPAQAVVELEHGATIASDAALSLLSAAGAVVLLLSPDLGTLARLCHRILDPGAATPRWVPVDTLYAGRGLVLRVARAGSDEWLRLPVGGRPVEGMLAACRASGLVVLESRVDYEWAVAR